VNDVVLAMCSAALRRYLADEDCRPAKPLIAGVPVSLREAGNTDLNNQVSMMFVGLATDIKDPLQRLSAIRANAVAAKEVTSQIKTAIPTDFPSFGAPWLMSGLASLYGRSRLANVIPPLANVAISNVPGSPVPLYLAGARVASYIPVSIPGHGVGLNITVQSYDGVLGFGITACRRAVPDPQSLAAYLRGALAELLAAVRAGSGEHEKLAKQAKAVDVAKKVKAAVAKKAAGARAPVARAMKSKRPELRVVAG
jgi:WS/DGAT/MGAT family acyltransferase